MIKQTAVKLANVFLKENVITDKQYKRSVFGIEVMLTAFVKLRHSAGGYHANTAFKCFLMTAVSFLV